MIPENIDDPDDRRRKLSEELEEKDAQVLRREPLETELMEEDESEVGEQIAGVEDQT